MSYLFLLQGIFPTQGSNSDLPHGRQILYHLSHMAGVQCNPCQNAKGICNNNKNLKFTRNHRGPQIPKSTFKEKNKAGDTASSDEHYTKNKGNGNINNRDGKLKISSKQRKQQSEKATYKVGENICQPYV